MSSEGISGWSYRAGMKTNAGSPWGSDMSRHPGSSNLCAKVRGGLRLGRVSDMPFFEEPKRQDAARCF